MLLRFRKFLEGGAMTPEELGGAPMELGGAPMELGGAPMEQGGAPNDLLGEDPMEQILLAAVQAVQLQDCKTALEVCLILVLLAQGGAQGGAPQQGAANQGEPVYRHGGRLVGRLFY